MSSKHLTVSLQSSGFTGDILLPDDGELWDLSTRPWGCQRKKAPRLALRPQTAEDVSKAVLWLHENRLDFAVRSGGCADSQSDDVIIDLANLTKISYNADKEVVHLGSGSTWRDIYKSLSSNPETSHITVVGGRVSYVGVGGFLTGGGLSFLSNERGTGAQNVVDAQVVLADGRIVWISEEEDLAMAIKGAGFSFGVVTEFVVKAIPRPSDVYGGSLIYTADKFDALIERLSKFANEVTNPRVTTLLGFVQMPPQMHPVAILMLTVLGDDQDGSSTIAKNILGWAWEIGPAQDMTSIMSYEQTIFAQDAFVQRPNPTSTYQLDCMSISQLSPKVLKAGLEWQKELQSREDHRFDGAVVLYEPFLRNCFKSDLPAAWPPVSSGSVHVLQMLIEQPNAADGHAEENAALLRKGIEMLTTAAKREGISVLSKYPNYALSGSPAVEFYGDKLEILKALKRKYDPMNKFNKGIQIGL